MRMDTAAELSARELVNEADERELALIFKRFGEERYARQIARAIVRRREERPFERTTDLADTIKQAIPTPARFGDGHPAKRVFQALRIAVNDELGALEAALPAAVRMLRPGGRIAVISFHSLEDRIVKQFIREQARGCTCPPEFPICTCGNEPVLRDLTRKPLRPGAARARGEPARRLRKASRRREGRSVVASWAGTARVDSPPVARPRRVPADAIAPRRRARTRPFGGVVWIVVLAVLLAGVVAVNVAVLQLNVRLDELGRERIELQGETKRLSSQLSSASANARIESQARVEARARARRPGADLPRAAGAADEVSERLSNRRIRLLLGLFVLVFAGTLARAVWLQGVQASRSRGWPRASSRGRPRSRPGAARSSTGPASRSRSASRRRPSTPIRAR